MYNLSKTMPNPKHNSNLVLSRLKQIQEPLLRQTDGGKHVLGRVVQFNWRAVYMASCCVIRALFHHKV